MARNKHPEETVAKILDVSMRLFTEQGYEHTTIQDIVDALGMSKGALRRERGHGGHRYPAR